MTTLPKMLNKLQTKPVWVEILRGMAARFEHEIEHDQDTAHDDLTLLASHQPCWLQGQSSNFLPLLFNQWP